MAHPLIQSGKLPFLLIAVQGPHDDDDDNSSCDCNAIHPFDTWLARLMRLTESLIQAGAATRKRTMKNFGRALCQVPTAAAKHYRRRQRVGAHHRTLLDPSSMKYRGRPEMPVRWSEE